MSIKCLGLQESKSSHLQYKLSFKNITCFDPKNVILLLPCIWPYFLRGKNMIFFLGKNMNKILNFNWEMFPKFL